MRAGLSRTLAFPDARREDEPSSIPSGKPGAWSSAWRTVAAITLFEIVLAAGLRWGLPRVVASPAIQMGIGYVVFMALGEIWGQWRMALR